jgi:hypothetical protein
MMRAAVLAVLAGCSPAFAQVAPTTPAKPTVAKPSAPKPPVVSAPAAGSAKLASLKAELGSVDKQIAALKAKQSTGDALSALSEEDMRWMQQLMTQKGQLEIQISNAMKSASE